MSYIRYSHLQDALNIAVWAFISLEVILSIVVIGITAAAANGFKKDLHCDSPSKLNYNISIGVITFLILPMLVVLGRLFPESRRPLGSLTPKLWLVVYGIFVVLWAAAVGSSFYSCSDLCSACSVIAPSYIKYAGKCCNCVGVDGISEDFCETIEDDQVLGFERRHHYYEAAQGLDIALMFLFLLSGAAVIVTRYVKQYRTRQEDNVRLHENMPDPTPAPGEQEYPDDDQAPPYDK